jgi:hypothetical protein
MVTASGGSWVRLGHKVDGQSKLYCLAHNIEQLAHHGCARRAISVRRTAKDGSKGLKGQPTRRVANETLWQPKHHELMMTRLGSQKTIIHQPR